MTPLPPRQNPAPLPPNGLASNSNYFLYAGTPLLGLVVHIDVTEDIVSDLGFGFQVNCWSQAGPLCQWQQYVLGHWSHADLTALIGAPPAAAGSALVGYAWTAGNSKQVVYLDATGHVHELWIVAGASRWSHADLTALIGAPPAARGSALVGYQRTTGNSKQVAYLDSEAHLHQLRIASGGAWSHTDLTAVTGAPLVAGSPLCGYDWLAD